MDTKADSHDARTAATNEAVRPVNRRNTPYVKTCEGCGAVSLPCRGLPDGWTQFGSSGLPETRVASWCASCEEDGTMMREAQSTRSRAVERKRRNAAGLPEAGRDPSARIPEGETRAGEHKTKDVTGALMRRLDAEIERCDKAEADLTSLRQQIAALAQEMETIKAASRALVTGLVKRHYGRMPDEVQSAFDTLQALLQEPRG